MNEARDDGVRRAILLYRVGGWSGVLIGIGYVLTIPLYLVVGQPPAGGAEWLRYGADKASVWWAIVALSVVTDLLFVPLAFALYRALKSAGRDEMLFATALACAFVALDLAVTWPNFAALITLSERQRGD